MQLWRLYRAAHGPGLDGAGGLYTAGRWHELGSRVVYFGASASIVALERLAHVDPILLPRDLILACYGGEISMEEVALGEVDDIHDLRRTRARGEAFLKAKSACTLRVPSIIVPEDFNYLFNPLHADAVRVRLVSSRAFEFDSRLL